MKKVKKESRRKCQFSTFSKRVCPIFLAAIASLFPGQEPILRADLDTTTDPLNWVLNSDGENPYKFTIGSGPNTPSGQVYTLTINADAVAFPTGNNSAISVSDNWTVYVNGLIQNQANGNGGFWNAGPNTIESRSNTTVIVSEGAQVLATGNQSNGEAINFIGNYNRIENHGLVQSRSGAAIWFQDTVTSPANSNTVDNYGTIRTLKGSNSSAIGNTGNNGVVFINREGGLVDGGLSFAGGNDELTFEPNSTVTGQINGGGGTNSLVLQGKVGSSDSIAGAVRNFTTLTKTGEGEWTVTGSLSGFTRVDVERGILRLTGDNTGYNGSVVINSSGYYDDDAVLEAKARSLPTTTSNVGNIKNDGILRFVDSKTDDDGGIGSYAGQITGRGKVEVAGDGVVTLTNTDNTYSGGTHVKNGTLNVISDATLGAADGEIVLGDGTIGQPSTAGTLQFGAGFDLGSARSIRTEGAGGTIDTNGFDTTISQGITGGTFTKAGAGTLTLTGENTYAGGTYITGGTLQVGDGGTEGSIPYVGILSITGADAALAINRSDAVNIPTRITGAGKFIQRGTGTTTLTGTNAYAGGTDIENGTLVVQSNLNLGTGGMTFGTATTGGTLRMNGNVDLNGRAITLNTGGGTIDTNGFRGSASGVISGVGGLTKDGDGVLTLTGNSTYTGGTTIAGGAIQLGDGGTSGSIVGNVANDGTLIFNRSDDVNSLALSGAISGTGNLIQRGSGTTTLSGGNSYSGGTVIENGTLAVNADAALGAATGSLTFGTATTNGTLKLTADIDDLADQRNVTINRGGGTIDTGGYHGTTDADMAGNGKLTKTGTGTLTLTGTNTYTGGTTVSGGELELGDGGTSGSIIGNVTVETADSTVVYNRSDESTDPAGTVSGSGNVIQRGTGTTTITNTNTYTGSTTLENGTLAISRDANLGNGGAVIFDGGKLRLNADLTDFNSSRQVTLKSSGTIDTLGNTGTIGSVIDGSGTLTKDGSGTLILTGTNTYIGGTIIDEGTLKIGDGGNSGSILGNVVNSGTLIFDRDGTVTYPGVISGTGNVIQQGGNSGTGTTIFTGDNTYTGGTTITSGTLQLGDGGTSGNITGSVANDGTLAFNRSDSFVFDGVVSGDGNLHQMGTGTTILTGTNTYTGGTLITGGALQLGDCGTSGSIVGDVVNNSQLIFSRSDPQTGANAFTGLISGTGAVVKDCSNVLELTAENTFTGGTELRRGGILITNAQAYNKTDGVGANAGTNAGHVLFSTVGSDTRRTVEVAATITQLTNHFHVVGGANNVFQTTGDLEISGVMNNTLGGAFYVVDGTLDMNLGGNLTLKNNKVNDDVNDIFVELGGILNINVQNAGDTASLFCGTWGGGELNLTGPGTVELNVGGRMGTTHVQNGTLRLNNITYISDVFDLETGATLAGHGIVDANTSAVINGLLTPDGWNGKFGTLMIDSRTAPTTLDGFTYTYDVAGATSADYTNDLVKFVSQNVTITGGTVDFVTAGSAGLARGRYLVFDSTSASYLDASGTALTDATLNEVLTGTVNGVAMTADTPRIGYSFDFNNDPAQNQIWLGVERNTLQTVWQGGDHDWTPGNWQSVQHNGTVYAKDFNDGDLAIFSNANGDADVSLVSNIIVSGLQIEKAQAGVVINVKIDGDYGISARKTDATIEGKYALTDGSTPDPAEQQFNTTGKLEIFGVYDNHAEIMTTLTLANTGVNEFREGIDIYGGKIALEGPSGRLGTYGNDVNNPNAGLVTFKVPDDPEVQKHVVEVNAVQTLQNRFVVESNQEGVVNNAFIIANANTTISGITAAVNPNGAVEMQDETSLTLQANGTSNLVLTGNGTTDVKMGEHTQLTVEGTGNTFVQSGMQGATGSYIIKRDAGTLQIEANSHVDQISVDNGTLRIFKTKTLGNADTSSFYVAFDGQHGSGDPAYIAGAGTVQAERIEVRGHISPDDLDAADATPAVEDRYGTLTLIATGSSPTLKLEDFTMNFDVTVPTTWNPGSTVMPTNDQDLLILNGTTVTIAGSNTIDFRTAPGGSFAKGDYLVVKSSDGYSPGAVNSLTAKVDGYGVSGTSPRGTLEFELRDSITPIPQSEGDGKDIWLVNKLNSLTMDWIGVTPQGSPDTPDVDNPYPGFWSFHEERMVSLQDNGAREYQFMNGDKVHIYNPNDGENDPAITVSMETALSFQPVTATLSGLVVGRNSGGTLKDKTAYPAQDQNGDVTIAGSGSIIVDASTAFGTYVGNSLTPTGKLQKYGTGGLLVMNTGGNRFLSGTELYNGEIIIGHEKALGAVDGSTSDFDGYVFFTGTENVTRTVAVSPFDADGNRITNITNHFQALAVAGTNVFEVDNALTISGVVNNNPTTTLGGAFYVGANSNLTINADADFTLSGNSYNAVSGTVANDIYLMTGSTLNVNVADGKGMFVNSGILGRGGTIDVLGEGFVQISRTSIFSGTTTVETDATLRVMTTSGGYGDGSSHTFYLNTGANLEGNGAVGVITATIAGNISPDKMVKQNGDDVVAGDDRYGVLRIAGNNGSSMTLNGFSFDYDVKNPNGSKDGPSDTPNDLLQLSMDTVTIGTGGGTIDFRTNDGLGVLTDGKYLIIHSNRAITLSGAAVSPDDLLAGKIDGTAFDDFGPRRGYDFRFNDVNEESTTANSQIWLDVSLNSLTMDWTGLGGTVVWNETDSNFRSLQTGGNGTVRESVFRNGDKVHFAGNTDYTVELGSDVLVSGLVVGKDSGTDGTDGHVYNTNMTISGDYGITARLAKTVDETDIIGKFIGDTLFPTGYLDKYGEGTLTFTNTGGNLFTEGIDLYLGTIGFNNANQLLVGDGKAITFRSTLGNMATLRADETTDLNTDIIVGSGRSGQLYADEGKAMLIQLTISGGGGLYKYGKGIVQLGRNSTDFSGSSTVEEGTFRVVGDRDDSTSIITFGRIIGLNTSFTVGGNVGPATLAGGGIIEAKWLVVGFEGKSGEMAYINPDSANLTIDNIEVPEDKKFGTLTFRGDSSYSTADFHSYLDIDNGTRNGFRFEYDVNAPNTVGSTSTTNDLLVLDGMTHVCLQGGVVNFRTGTNGLRSGNYLVIDSNVTIKDGNGKDFKDGHLMQDGVYLDGINDYATNGGVLWGKINDQDIREGSPRRHLEFVLRNKEVNSVTVQDSQIWLDVQNNTLQVVWQGGPNNLWTTANSWESVQYNNVTGTDEYDNEFYFGDYVIFDNSVQTGGYTVTLNEDVVVSGMDLAPAAGQTIVLDGTGDIKAVKDNPVGTDYIEGVYANGAAGQNQRFDTTGMLKKTGAGTWTFTNTGTNLFDEGIEIQDGILSYNHESQLTVGIDAALTFTGNGTLRSDAVADLYTDVVIETGVTGTLHAENGNAMLLQETLRGAGNLTKTGEGIVQLGTSSAIDGHAAINDGAFRVLDGNGFAANTVVVAGPASLQGGGTVTGNTITVNGNLSPDTATLTTAEINVPDADEIGTLTLNADTITLNGFTLDYDVDAPNTSGDPTDTSNDLLRITGDTTLTGGVIALRDSSKPILEDGDYLIVDADRTITVAGGNPLDGINDVGGVLAATYNGTILTNNTPRHEFGFEFRDYNNVTDSQIWLTNEVNTLFMNWKAGENDWGGAASWTSTQTTLSGGRAEQFRDGDFASFTDTTDDSTANLVGDVLVSGLDTSTNQTVLFTGAGGITAQKSDQSMIGKFVETDDNEPLNAQGFYTTGLLRKYAVGTTTFANTGANRFEEGIEIHGGILSYSNSNQLNVDDDKFLTFKGDSTLRADATAALNPAVFVETGVTGTLSTGDGISMLLNNTVSGDGTLVKTGDGTVQFNTDSLAFDGTTNADAGVLRILHGKTFGSDATVAGSALNVNRTEETIGETVVETVGTIAGAGTFKAETITVHGDISPDNFVGHVDGSRTGDKIGTLTLAGTTIKLDNFVFRYDVTGPNGLNDPAETPNDLLQTRGTTTLVYGTVDFQGTLGQGKYLVVDSDGTILAANGSALDWETLDGINFSGGALKATNNGNDLSNASPRAEYLYELADRDAAGSQIWLSVDRNTLTMTWNGGDGEWGKASGWTSAQYKQTDPDDENSKVYAHDIERGDYARIINDTPDSSFTVTITADQRVSGLELGGAGGVVLDGASGVTAVTNDGDWIRGLYVDEETPIQPKVPVDGKLTKTGSGTATFANSGTNLFNEGVELYNGILSYNNANQLTVGDGKFLTFKDDATLRADATADLNTAVAIETGKTGTLHTGDGIAMLLQKSISGGGNLTKTGDGIVQLGVTSTIGGDADLEAGAFRVVENTTFTAGTVLVTQPASLQGGGTVSGDTITVNGHISPDATTLTTSNIAVPGADRFGTLTLVGNVLLDDFVFDYDLGTADTGTDPSQEPTGDLLKIVGGADLQSGHVAFSGTIGSGKYLIIDSDSAIDVHDQTLDGINEVDGILTASLNGKVLTNETPRHELEFVFENEQKQIWLETEVNTLYMQWAGGTGDWNLSDANWESSQTTLSGGVEHVFRGGDFVVFNDQSQDSHATLNTSVIVGGLDTNTGNNVTISGAGGITAKKSDESMIGKFVKTDGDADPDEQEFDTTGMLRKYGLGTTIFENTGGNLFTEGIELYQGATEFNRADQLAVGDGKLLTFKGNSTLRPTASLDYGVNIGIDDNVTGTFDTATGVTFGFGGTMTGSDSSAFTKTSGGTMNLNADSTDFNGAIDVAGGTLGVYSNYGNSKSFVVRDGATLTGNGTIGGGEFGTIQDGGTLAPQGYTSGNPVVTHLTVNGDLTFESGSNFDVTISQNPNDVDADGKMAPVSDYVKVQNGETAIDSGAKMNVEIDYWGGALSIEDFNEEKSSKFTVIDATEGSVEDEDAQFVLNPSAILPRGVKIAQGWQNYESGWMDFGDGWLYQLWFEKDPTRDFEHLCDRHNRVEIGKNLDQLVMNADPALKDLIMHLSASCFTDQEVCQLLDQLTGDLRANSLMMAMKTPWRSPFSRLDEVACLSGCGDPCSAVKRGPHKFQLWGEWTARHDDVRSDRNAHPYTINRVGVTVGADKRISHRTTLGLAFNYSDPKLRQATGKAEMDDYEIGLYGRTRLNNDWMLKYYAGYSHQRYDLTRNVYIPACEQDGFAALSERFRNSVDGDALAMSVELIRAFKIRENLRLLPTLAFDFNQAWQKGYRETGGLTALEYKKTSLERMMMRIGLGAEWAVRNNIDLKARIQYATQVNSHEQPRSLTRFANATIADQRYADIWGTRIGRDYLNLGIGMDWQPNRFRDVTLFINYDADLYRRATTHSGQAGLVKRW